MLLLLYIHILKIYSFISLFLAALSLLLHMGFLELRQAGATLGCGVRASLVAQHRL